MTRCIDVSHKHFNTLHPKAAALFLWEYLKMPMKRVFPGIENGGPPVSRTRHQRIMR
jgi:hypothetical protein